MGTQGAVLKVLGGYGCWCFRCAGHSTFGHSTFGNSTFGNRAFRTRTVSTSTVSPSAPIAPHLESLKAL